MGQFRGFRNAKGIVVLTPEELLNKYREYFQGHGLTSGAREKLTQQLLRLNNDTEYVESAMKWAAINSTSQKRPKQKTAKSQHRNRNFLRNVFPFLIFR